MAKNWWFKLDWDDWLTDGELSACSLETQGFWMRCICLMNRADVCELTGTIEQLRRKLGVLPEELTRCLHDLKTNNAANVRFGNGDVSILSRRRQKELKAKENNRLYVAKHRAKDGCKTGVSIQSKSKSNNKEIKKKNEEENPSGFSARIEDGSMDIFEQEQIHDGFPIDDLIASFPEIVFTPAQVGHILADVKDTPIDREAWTATLKLYRLNYDPMKRSYLPTRIGTLLSVFNDEKTKIERGKNGKTNGKRTDADVLAESADFYANYDQQPIA